jgi:hypothetical protein
LLSKAASRHAPPRLLRWRTSNRELRAALEAGAFYRAAVQQAGPARTCRPEVNDGTLAVAYDFPDGVTPEARRNPSIEFTAYRLGSIDLSRPAAVVLLREAERASEPTDAVLSGTRRRSSATLPRRTS